MSGPTVTWQGEDVDVTAVERRLSDLWAQLTQETALSAAVRTSIFNLVVYTSDDQMADEAARELSELADRHPSRAIILVADRLHPQSRVDAAATIHCNMNTGSQPLCCEQVRLTAKGRAADHLSSVVVPLLMPELKTYLWWPGQPPFGHRVFHRLLSVADQLVLDSSQFTSPGDGFANLTQICLGRQGVKDLNWGRLTPWREIVAQFFDGQNWLPYASGIRSVRVEFGAGGTDFPRVTAGTLLLVGWVASYLGWEPETTLDGLAQRDVTLAVLQGERIIPIEIQFRDHGPNAKCRLMALELVSQPKGLPPARFSVERLEDMGNARVSMQVHEGTEICRVVTLDLRDDVELLADELDAARHDHLYDQVVHMASRMAGREIWIPA